MSEIAKSWGSEDDRQKILARARKFWDDDHPFRGWSPEERDCYMIRAAMEACALGARWQPIAPPTIEL